MTTKLLTLSAMVTCSFLAVAGALQISGSASRGTGADGSVEVGHIKLLIATRTLSEQQSKEKSVARAEQVRLAYEHLQELNFSVDTEEWPSGKKAAASMAMKKADLTTLFSIEGVPVAKVCVKDGRYSEELLPRKNVRIAGSWWPRTQEVTGEQIEYPALAPGDDDGFRLLEKIGAYRPYVCLLGAYANSWIGKGAHRSDFFWQVLTGGEFIGTEIVLGSTCDVFLRKREGFWDVLYIRSDQMVSRFDTIEWKDGKPTMLRTRLIQYQVPLGARKEEVTSRPNSPN